MFKMFYMDYGWSQDAKEASKQTNKQTILDQLYLSQIKSNIHEILRVSDWDPLATKWGPEGPPVGGRRPPALRRS